jgi:hypothetical protein
LIYDEIPVCDRHERKKKRATTGGSSRRRSSLHLSLVMRRLTWVLSFHKGPVSGMERKQNKKKEKDIMAPYLS